jgi:hypothetical protein
VNGREYEVTPHRGHVARIDLLDKARQKTKERRGAEGAITTLEENEISEVTELWSLRLLKTWLRFEKVGSRLLL